MRTILLLTLSIFSAFYIPTAWGQTLPADWQSTDIGFTDVPGEAYVDNTSGYWVVKGSGFQMWENRDDFHFAYQQVLGDFDVQVQVVSHTASSNSAKAGIEIRSSLDTNAMHLLTGLEPWGGAAMVSRDAVNGASAWNGSGDYFPPYWVRVERAGDMLTGYRSVDGSNWETIETLTLANLSNSLYVGLAVHANAETLSEAEFDGYTLNGQVVTSVSNTFWGDILLAPNPARDFLSLDLPTSVSPLRYVILNSQGQSVQQGRWEGELINVSQLSAGLYTLVLEGENAVWRNSFLKN